MTGALVRLLPSPRAGAVLLGVLACLAIGGAATGFGATSTLQSPTASVVNGISLSDPSALEATPPVCTDALAPLDTDDCTDVAFTPGTSKVLRLGSLSGTDVQAGALRWSVTTTNATGYRVHMSNAGPAPLLSSAGGSIADMSSSSLVAEASVDDATHFGVAMGDPTNDDQGAVGFPGSPWVAGGQQGALFSGIPVTGMVVAERSSPQTNDPFTATFAVAAVGSQPPTPGAYGGTVRVIASVI